jgi:ATP-dependent DNA helicase RecG
MSNDLSTPVNYLKSIGAKRAEAFAKVGIKTVNDLLFYFPSKHLDRSKMLNVKEVIFYVGQGYEGEVTVIGKVMHIEKINYGKKSLLKVEFTTPQGMFACVWFQRINYFEKVFTVNDTYAISGKPSLSRYGNLQFTHPDYDKLKEEETDFLHTGKIIPIYKVPAELKTVNLGEYGLRSVINDVVNNYVGLLKESLPEFILKKYNLLNIKESVQNIHFPENIEKLNEAFKRFKYEELFYIECLVALKHQKYKLNRTGISFKVHSEPIKKFLSILGFELTKAQLKVLSEIRKDMESPQPMNRLLQGDVGSGKTVVSVVAMLIAISNGYQTVLMAPTEILAQQHFKSVQKMTKVLGLEICLLIGSQSKTERESVLSGIANGNVNIVIGTHALIEEKVIFNKLGLVIIDEQHRFGVNQRGLLIDKGVTPDILVMSATPIPRTLSMSVYGDLDISIIDELPIGRLPIKTYLRADTALPDIYKYIIDNSKKGFQSFLVYPLVEESEKMDLKAAETYYLHLCENELKDVKVGLLHGKMNWKEKEEIMYEFSAGKYDVLVATTVIEVGIDIPNANLIVINDAFRFGLSQLHQLRGRVGRSDLQSYCILVVPPNLLSNINKINLNFSYLSKKQIEYFKTQIRMQSLVKYTSGFELSEIDLKLRGPGDIFGTKQSGFPELRFADIINDSEILFNVKEEAFNIILNDPNLYKPENKVVKETIYKKYYNNLVYSEIG